MTRKEILAEAEKCVSWENMCDTIRCGCDDVSFQNCKTTKQCF